MTLPLSHLPDTLRDEARSLMYDSRLFQPLVVGERTLQNRLVCEIDEAGKLRCLQLQAHSAPRVDPDQCVCGLWVLAAGSVHPSSGMPSVLHEAGAHAALRSMAQVAALYGAKLFQRLTHGGHLMPAQDGGAPWSVSSGAGPRGIVGHAMTPEEIRELRLAFVSAALMCQDSGLDGVEISATDGQLVRQFIDPAHNHRNDRYGGSCQNRCRFLIETLRGVRAAVGPAFSLGVSARRDEDTLFNADGSESNLLGQLRREKLIDFMSLSGPGPAPPPSQPPLPRIMTRPCDSLEHAGRLLASGSADLLLVALDADPLGATVGRLTLP